LLERAARLNVSLGGGSLTALPIIETQANDMSAYIPTNVISITDGQIYLESGLFYSGFRPAINIGLSVSRVGGAAQIKAMKQTAGTLRIDLAQFRELESFSQFASELDEATRNQLLRGEKLMEVLKQKQFTPMPVAEQVIVLFAGIGGFLDDIETDKIGKFEEELLRTFRTQHGEILKKIVSEGKMSEQLKEQLKTVINKFKETFTA
jgi:F-type H+-transporting ATPase subunit alpha